jgi:hypothetical protein
MGLGKRCNWKREEQKRLDVLRTVKDELEPACTTPRL